jgi:transcriptional regulator GlxA family with amidase domain
MRQEIAMSDRPINVVLLTYPGVQTLDIAGPLDAFTAASQARPDSYSFRTVSLTGAPLVTESGLKITPDCALHEMTGIDTLMVPGGAGLRSHGVAEEIAQALRNLASGCRRLVSICTGIYAVARSGLLDGRRVTTHWRFAQDVARLFPALSMDSDKIFIKDGQFYSSAGITAAIDLSLALIEEDYGPQLALTVARELVVYVKRSGGQRQFSEPLKFQAKAADRFGELAGWIAGNLTADLSIEKLAARTSLSPRQFNRRFTEAFGEGPSTTIETLRLDAARDHLTGSNAAVEAIATAVGFRSGDAFRRAFDRRFGLGPSEYRRRFAPMLSPRRHSTGRRDTIFNGRAETKINGRGETNDTNDTLAID